MRFLIAAGLGVLLLGARCDNNYKAADADADGKKAAVGASGQRSNAEKSPTEESGKADAQHEDGP